MKRSRVVTVTVTMLALGLGLLAGTRTASALGYDEVAADWPDGWSDYPGKSQALKKVGAAGGAIALELNWGGTAAQNAMKSAQRAGLKQVTKQQDIAFMGRAGYLVVGKSSARMFAAIATSSDDGGVVLLLDTPMAAWASDVNAWGGMADGMHLLADGGDSGSTDAGASEDSEAPAIYDVTLRNNAKNCTAPVVFAGQEHQLAPGTQIVVQVRAGSYEFRWTDWQNSWKSGTWSVPEESLFSGACGAAAEPEPAAASDDDAAPAPEAAAAPDTEGQMSDAELNEKSQWFIIFMCWMGNEVAAENVMDPQKKIPQMLPGVMQAARANPSLYALVDQMPGLFQRAKEDFIAADEAARDDMLVNFAGALHNLTNGAWINVNQTCDASDDGRFCAVVALRVQLRKNKLAKQQMDNAFNNQIMMNIMNIQHQTMMNISNNI